MQIVEEQGYLIPATSTGLYIDCAARLADSIHAHNPHAQVCLLTDQAVENNAFDHVRLFPYENMTGNPFAWDWQVFRSTPFRETIKLEADMLVTSNIDHYWDLFCKRDVVVSTGARDFYGRVTHNRHYRSIIDQNRLPDVYNAITYWRLSNTAKEFFDLVKTIFENWDHFRRLITFPEAVPSTDIVYAIATRIIGEELVTLPARLSPKIVHMKRHINPIQTENWTKELVWEHIDAGLKINTVRQTGLFHYYIKDWLQ